MEKASSAKQPKRSSVTAGITVVGMGNWGTSLIAALTRARVALVEVVVRQPLGRQGDTLPEVKAENAVYNANVLWLCVPDREIAAVAAQIAEQRPDLRGQAVIHSSGAATLAALQAVKRAGAEVAGIAPVFSFPTREPVPLEGVAFMVECRPPLWPQASSLVERLGGRPFRINSADKVLYHAAATMASPLLVSALESAVATARLAGLGEDDAKSILGALALKTARNYFEGSSAKSFSGPFARGDAQTVELHLDALLKHPKLYDIYVALAKNAIANLPVRNLRGLQRALNIAPASEEVPLLATRRSKEQGRRHDA